MDFDDEEVLAYYITLMKPGPKVVETEVYRTWLLTRRALGKLFCLLAKVASNTA